MAVSDGYHRNGLSLMHAVAIVYKYAAHNTFVRQRDVGSTLHGKDHPRIIDLVTHITQNAPYNKC